MTSDTIGGDKADGNVIKRNISVSAETGSAVSVGGGDAVVGTQIKDVAGNVIIQHHVSDKDAARNQRIRQHLLDQLQATWIQGVLENSLYEVARLELGLESRPDAVERPWVMSLERPNQPPQSLPPTSKILDTFKVLNGSMLILGEPGSGKTITLLELARELRKVALADERQPVPLVFNLASWAQEQPPLLDWLVGELFLVYGVGRKQAPEWLKTMPFHLLLDGLDEVTAEHRDTCVAAINEFREEYGPVNMVVCSRREEYTGLTKRLRLMGAAIIQPLDQNQINAYLSAVGPHLVQLANNDPALQELARTPLTLNIIALAYQGHLPDEIFAGTTQEHRCHLFAAYVERMFGRRGSIEKGIKQQYIRYLIWLAARMQEYSQSVYFIEKMQADWLGRQKQQYQVSRMLSFGIGFGVIYSLIYMMSFGLSFGLIGGLIFGLIGGLIFGLFLGRGEIVITEALKWSGRKGVLSFGVRVGLIGGLIAWLIGGRTDGLIFGLIFTLIGWLIGGLTSIEVQFEGPPNRRIWISGRNAVNIGLIFGLSVGLTIGLIGDLIYMLIFGLSFGLSVGLRYGGDAFIRHFLVRWVLARQNYLPFKIVPFLDEMADRIILRKVGGGYIFIHRMLLDYFADLEGNE